MKIAEEEFANAADELKQRAVCDEIMEIFLNGGVSYREPIEECFAEIKIDSLFSVLRKAEEFVRPTEKLQKMIFLGKILYEIRDLVLKKNWISVLKVIDDFDYDQIEKFPQYEVEFEAIKRLSTIDIFISRAKNHFHTGINFKVIC